VSAIIKKRSFLDISRHQQHHRAEGAHRPIIRSGIIPGCVALAKMMNLAYASGCAGMPNAGLCSPSARAATGDSGTAAQPVAIASAVRVGAKPTGDISVASEDVRSTDADRGAIASETARVTDQGCQPAIPLTPEVRPPVFQCRICRRFSRWINPYPAIPRRS